MVSMWKTVNAAWRTWALRTFSVKEETSLNAVGVNISMNKQERFNFCFHFIFNLSKFPKK